MDAFVEEWPGSISRSDPVQAAWPGNVCFGCGPANDAGLGLKSYIAEDGESLVATFDPDSTHTAGYPGTMYGGLLASLIDCHSLWTAMTFAYREAERPLMSEPLLMYVTGELTTRYEEPTPLEEPLRLEAWVDGDVGDTVEVQCEVGPGDEVTARGEQVAVRMRDPPPLDAATDH